jgi:ubiquinone/menaquinone biosynthesis C-methylase UbiE
LELAKSLNIEAPPYDSASDIFSFLIKECHRKHCRQVAVLIDEYDAPITDLLDKPNQAQKARVALREFYRVLKANDEYISFVFVTGITKFVKGGVIFSL